MQRYVRLAAASLALSATLMLVFGFAYPALVWALSLAVPKSGPELASCYGEKPQFFKPFAPENTSSGCDPFVPLDYALRQVPEVSRKTGLPEELVARVLRENAEKYRAANLYVLGPGYDIVNVVEVNKELAKLAERKGGGGG